jgi:dTMP kinase
MVLEKRLKVDYQTLQMMFTVDRADHLEGEWGIINRLKQGQIVITDRYLFSTLAFGHSSGLDTNWLAAMQSRFIIPDITFFLDVSPEVCIERVRSRGSGMDLFEKKEQLEKAREGYTKVGQMFGKSIKTINGERKPNTIGEEIFKDISGLAKYKDLLKSSQQVLIK